MAVANPHSEPAQKSRVQLNSTYQRMELQSAPPVTLSQRAIEIHKEDAEFAGIGALPKDWIKMLAENGTPYYLHRVDKVTQWLDPRVESGLTSLKQQYDWIRLAAYRTANKIRGLQNFSYFSMISLTEVQNAFHAAEARLELYNPHDMVNCDTMSVVLLQLYTRAGHTVARVEMMVSWLLFAFDRQRLGGIPLQSFKTALTILSLGWVEEKYRFLFSIYDVDNDGIITCIELRQMLLSFTRIIETIDEAYAFTPNAAALDKAVADCYDSQFECLGTDIISLEGFIEWGSLEPDILVWLPVMHRVAATNDSKHEVKCSGCSIFPIVGFCYSTTTVELCQYCFWSNEYFTARAQYMDEEFTEYCFQRNRSMENKRLFKSMIVKVKRAFTTGSKKKKIRQRGRNSIGNDNYKRASASGRGPDHNKQQRDSQHTLIHDVSVRQNSLTNAPAPSFGGRLAPVQATAIEKSKMPLSSRHTALAPGARQLDADEQLAEEHGLIMAACAEVPYPPSVGDGTYTEGGGGGTTGSKKEAGGIPSTQPGGLFHMAESMDNEQKLYLLRVIDELDADNRDLIQQLMQTRDEMLFAIEMAKEHENQTTTSSLNKATIQLGPSHGPKSQVQEEKSLATNQPHSKAQLDAAEELENIAAQLSANPATDNIKTNGITDASGEPLTAATNRIDIDPHAAVSAASKVAQEYKHLTEGLTIARAGTDNMDATSVRQMSREDIAIAKSVEVLRNMSLSTNINQTTAATFGTMNMV